MSRAGALLLKSLLIGAAAGLVALVLSYGFLMIHEEVGFRPSVSFTPAALTFACATLAALVYFRFRDGR